MKPVKIVDDYGYIGIHYCLTEFECRIHEDVYNRASTIVVKIGRTVRSSNI